MARKPRIITKTVERLLALSKAIKTDDELTTDESALVGDIDVTEPYAIADKLTEWAEELDGYHGGSANLDPSKKTKRKKAAKR